MYLYTLSDGRPGRRARCAANLDPARFEDCRTLFPVSLERSG